MTQLGEDPEMAARVEHLRTLAPEMYCVLLTIYGFGALLRMHHLPPDGDDFMDALGVVLAFFEEHPELNPEHPGVMP